MNKEQIFKLLHEFIQQPRIQSTLSTIKECDISGWEGWLQVEFAHYVQNEVYNKKKFQFSWYREYKVITKSDRYDESDKNNKYIIPDFWISSDTNKLQTTEKDFYLIEFKRSNKGDIHKLMKEDIRKWRSFIDLAKNKRNLVCRNKTYDVYFNCGVFFVGIDTNGQISLDNLDAFDGLESEVIQDPFYHRIDFLKVK